MSNFTPGPWEYTENMHTDKIDHPYTITSKDMYFVGKTIGGLPPETCEANARLIAMAPDLLEACVFALEAIRLTREYVGEETLPNIEGWSHYDASRLLRSVILKADPTVFDESKISLTHYSDIVNVFRQWEKDRRDGKLADEYDDSTPLEQMAYILAEAFVSYLKPNVENDTE